MAALIFSSHFRGGLLLLVSLLAAAEYYRYALAGFLIVSGFSYAALLWLDRSKNRAERWKWACFFLVLLGILFTLGRLRGWEENLTAPGPLHIVLFSMNMWMVLRLVTVFWEVGSGSLALPPIGRYCVWMCLPFGFGGPLLRFSEFPKELCPDASLLVSESWLRGLAAAISKLCAGVFLTAALGLIAQRFPHPNVWGKGLVAVSGPFEFYLTYAGYYQLMEVLAALCGIAVPPSFNAPIGRQNISAFWANWNMTATRVFRDYLFYNRWGFERHNPYVNSIVLFTLVGLWHAANAYWILWGLLHGVYMCCFLLWRKHSKGLFGGLPLRGSATTLWAARAFTFLVVCSAWYLPPKLLQMLSH